MGEFRNYEVNGIKLYKSDFNTEWIDKYLGEKPKVIIEFGSYDGGDGAFYKQKYPDCMVFSLEACFERYTIIKENEKLLGIDVSNFAVCEYDGFVQFYPVKDPNVMDSLDKYGSSGSINKRTDMYKQKFLHIVEQNPVEVKSIRIDTFCKLKDIKSIDFLHVDVEGAEHRVIEGFGSMRPKIIWMETCLGKDYYGDNAYDINQLNTSIINMGYSIVEETNSDTLYLYDNN